LHPDPLRAALAEKRTLAPSQADGVDRSRRLPAKTETLRAARAPGMAFGRVDTRPGGRGASPRAHPAHTRVPGQRAARARSPPGPIGAQSVRYPTRMSAPRWLEVVPEQEGDELEDRDIPVPAESPYVTRMRDAPG